MMYLMTLSNDDLNFSDYQLATASTAIYPDVGTGSYTALSYCTLGLAGEAGEVAGKVKKVLRDDAGSLTVEKRKQLEGELGDVLWYLARLADELGVSLEVIAQANLEKLADRSARNVLGGSGDNR
jgi:NTP pyrophosphatase (non-canonical NTP hydrolase)